VSLGAEPVGNIAGRITERPPIPSARLSCRCQTNYGLWSGLRLDAYLARMILDRRITMPTLEAVDETYGFGSALRPMWASSSSSAPFTSDFSAGNGMTEYRWTDQ
jgi:hypothetical protein